MSSTIKYKGASILSIILIFILSCNSNQSKETNKSVTPEEKNKGIEKTEIDSSKLWLTKFNEIRPDFKVLIDSSTPNLSRFSHELNLDTSKCYSFWFDRTYFGEIRNLETTVHIHSSNKNNKYLKSGNISFWICPIPANINEGDTLIISGLLYDIFGNERTIGYPLILTKVLALSKK